MSTGERPDKFGMAGFDALYNGIKILGGLAHGVVPGDGGVGEQYVWFATQDEEVPGGRLPRAVGYAGLIRHVLHASFTLEPDRTHAVQVVMASAVPFMYELERPGVMGDPWDEETFRSAVAGIRVEDKVHPGWLGPSAQEKLTFALVASRFAALTTPQS